MDYSLYRCNKNVKSFNMSLQLAGQSERVKSFRHSDVNRSITDSWFNEGYRKGRPLERITRMDGDNGRSAVQTAVYCFQGS